MEALRRLGVVEASSPRGRCGSNSPCSGESSESSSSSSLPYAVCEAVAKAVWSYAKAQAQVVGTQPADTGASAEGAAAAAPDSKASPPAKRRRTGREFELDDETAAVLFPTMFGTSQPSQSQDEAASRGTDEALSQARLVLNTALAEVGGGEAQFLGGEVLGRVHAMTLAANSYWREVSLDMSKAASCLFRFLDHQRPLYWRHAPWRGVNLGGWLLLEPGPSDALFQQFDAHGCEWHLMQRMKESLGAERAKEVLQTHRETFIIEDDLRRIRALGMNAVRIPFGYWAVTGPSNGDEFVGPCLEYLDRVVDWCELHGLQALLDLHGAPGGESGEKPCGRERRDWRWQDWRVDESIEALRIVASRYKGREVVTGIAVCNEPSETVPAEVLCNFYDRAVTTIREAGMAPDEVSVLLPVYRSERLDEIWRIWTSKFDGFARHPNVAFDLHLYHCFGQWWQRQGLAGHLKMAKRHRKILRRVPAVVGEWSLALPPRGRCGDDQEEDEALRLFAEAQLEAYGQASHGWFFWNWRDGPRAHAGWDLQKCLERGWLDGQFAEVVRRAPARH